MPPTLIVNAPEPDRRVTDDVLSVTVDANRATTTLDSCGGGNLENKNQGYQPDAISRNRGWSHTELVESSATRTYEAMLSNDSVVEKSGQTARERAESEPSTGKPGGRATTFHLTESVPNANINVLETSTAPQFHEERTIP